MKSPTILTIRIIHSLIWVVMAGAVFYILYSGITGTFSIYLYLAYGLIVFEIITLLINGWACPLTLVAKAAKPDWQDGDDIFLPKTLAIHNKTIFGTLFIIGTILVTLQHLGIL